MRSNTIPANKTLPRDGHAACCSGLNPKGTQDHNAPNHECHGSAARRWRGQQLAHQTSHAARCAVVRLIAYQLLVRTCIMFPVTADSPSTAAGPLCVMAPLFTRAERLPLGPQSRRCLPTPLESNEALAAIAVRGRRGACWRSQVHEWQCRWCRGQVQSLGRARGQ